MQSDSVAYNLNQLVDFSSLKNSDDCEAESNSDREDASEIQGHESILAVDASSDETVMCPAGTCRDCSRCIINNESPMPSQPK